MTYLTIKARCATYALDQLLAARRRGVAICLLCGSSSTPINHTQCLDCMYASGFMLADPENLIVMNWGPQDAATN